MRSLHTPKLHLPSRAAQICRFPSQPYAPDVRQRRTAVLTSFFQSTDLQSHRHDRHTGSVQAGDELAELAHRFGVTGRA